MKSLIFILLSLHLVAASYAQDSRPKIGVVLSGGAARGFAHLGALQALEDNGIVPSYVAGASMGAVIGSIYANGMPPNSIYEFARKQKYRRLLNPSFASTGGLMKSTFIEKMLNMVIPHNSFDSLQKQFFVSVTNLDLARNEIMNSGNLKKVVCASASIPLIFEPTIIDGSTYVDGGLLNNLPVEPLLQIADCQYIIGISVVATPDEPNKEWQGLQPAMRSFSIIIKNTEKESRQKCHFFLEVEEVAMLRLADFKRIDDFYDMGYRAMTEYINNTAELRSLGTPRNGLRK
ncbi:phospholipase [Bacteroidia bacterium]|nr:phospholipase [Bacteroidia bacterium]